MKRIQVRQSILTDERGMMQYPMAWEAVCPCCDLLFSRSVTCHPPQQWVGPGGSSWLRIALVDHWHDGDTVKVVDGEHDPIERWWTLREQSILLINIDAPELNSPDPKVREQARTVRDLCSGMTREDDDWVVLSIVGRDKYGRCLADVLITSVAYASPATLVDTPWGQYLSLTQWLLHEGYAEPYGGAR